jgi:hypothetical protein
MSDKKWNYTVLRTNPDRMSDDYVEQQIEQHRYILIKSNMYAGLKEYLSDEMCELLGVNNDDEKDELIFWDDFPDFEGYRTLFDLLFDGK